MCGILLILSKKKKLNLNSCLKASKTIFNRGKDYEKYEFFNERKIFLYNSILGIQGKIEKKKKLYASKDRKINISYNGEIYNYNEILKKFFNNKKFINDTELFANIIQKKEKNLIIKKILGMFAVTVLDKNLEKIYFFTDPQGEKRLYYINNTDYLIVSSNFKAILNFYKNKKKINFDLNTLKDYFYTRHLMMESDTVYKDIKIVKPGYIYSTDFKVQKIKKKILENPLDWISEKEYRKYSKYSLTEITKIAEKKFRDTARMMKPNRNFSVICSGGIDSGIQAFLLRKSKRLKKMFSLNHDGKDNILFNEKSKFENKLKKKIFIKKIDEKEYSKLLILMYKRFKIPMLSHDMVGRFLISKLTSKFNSKIVFTADGADELFGGYENYLNAKLSNFKSIYSNYNLSRYNSKSLQLNKRYKNILRKYSFIKNNKERIIQSNLYNDYLSNCINTYNIMNDLVISDSSIETRNIYIQKNIIKFAINLPLKFKINLKQKKNFKLKIVLKKIFAKYFTNNLIKSKEGFSGFPNESKKFIKFSIRDKNLKKMISNNKHIKILPRDKEWKKINLCLFYKLARQG